jgi:hypothetical protein
MNINEFIGKTFVEILGGKGDENIIFVENNGKRYEMYHSQDCCEQVYIEDICGDLDWLIGAPIISASEDTNSEDNQKDKYDDSFTWTFYNIATAKGHVTIRWYGTSNGYYSESVDLEKIGDLN